MTKLQASKNNFLMVMSLFGVLVVGGSAMYLSNNKAVNYKTGASNVEESMNDRLAKRGTSAFSACKKVDLRYNYVLQSSCTPLQVNDSDAKPFIGKRVLVKGTKKDGVFYVTSITEDSVVPTASPKLPSNKYKLPPPRY